MKAVIWICSALAYLVAITLLKYAGITLGALETVFLYLLLIALPSKKLCSAWDKRRASLTATSGSSSDSGISAPPPAAGLAASAEECPDNSEVDTINTSAVIPPPDAAPAQSPGISRAWQDGLASVRQNTAAAEKRLGATEAEMRFAADIAAGIYTKEMIPSAMDTGKVVELADYYAAEQTFEGVLPRYQPGPAPAPRRARARFSAWVPAVCVLAVFAALCVYAYRSSVSPGGTPDSSAPPASDSSTNYAVDYKTGYVGSVNSDFVHRDTCRHAENILEENRVYYKSAADAVADGRVKCSACLSSSSYSRPSAPVDSSASFAQQYLELRGRRE